MDDETVAFTVGTILVSILVAVVMIVGIISGLHYSAHVRDVNLQRWQQCHAEYDSRTCTDLDD